MRTKHPTWHRWGFTLVEILISVAILAILMTLIAQVIGSAQRAWSRSAATVSQFREARRAFDRIVRNLGQATLNPYLSYVYPNADPRVPTASVELGVFESPAGYARFSELQFISGTADSLVPAQGGDLQGHAVFFQAPIGSTDMGISIPTALAAMGYFVQKRSDRDTRPEFLNQTSVAERERYRLYEYRSVAEANRIYDPQEIERQARGGRKDAFWTQDMTQAGRTNPVAENILCLILAPRNARVEDSGADPYQIAPDFEYNSSENGLSANQAPTDYQLPPMVDVIMVAVDESSAQRLEETGGDISFNQWFRQASTTSIRDDIRSVERALQDRKVNYRVFTGTVQIRSSRW